MKIVSYNVEWFDHLFNDAGLMVNDETWSGRRGVTKAQQLAALGDVFQALDADAIMVIEAPNHSRKRDGVAALETFAGHFGLRARAALIGFPNDTQQEITLLFDPDAITAAHDPQSGLDAPVFDGTLRIDLDVDAHPEKVRWSKPPLEVQITTAAGAPLRLIGVHAKSKAPHGARNEADVMRLSIANRRKQLAQCLWLRRRVDAHLVQGDDLVVLGDFNDGPGLDAYEKLFGRSGVEVVLGDEAGVQLFDPHAEMVLSRPTLAAPTSARFSVGPDGRVLSALLDYVMVSPGLRARSPRWRIWHPYEDPQCLADSDLQQALLTASDHFPVEMQIDI